MSKTDVDKGLTECQKSIAVAEKAVRDAQGKADATDAAVYDLKAVNPRSRCERDTRTPSEIIEPIAGHGKTV